MITSFVNGSLDCQWGSLFCMGVSIVATMIVVDDDLCCLRGSLSSLLQICWDPAGAVAHLCVALGACQQGQLIGCGEVGSDLLHLTEALPLPPLGSAVLEPHL